MVMLTALPFAWPKGLMLALAGLAGLAYDINAIRLKRRLGFSEIKPLDWIPYGVLPMLVNASLMPAGWDWRPIKLSPPSPSRERPRFCSTPASAAHGI
jgi:hypothetical protein